jgi:hypothetical protein
MTSYSRFIGRSKRAEHASNRTGVSSRRNPQRAAVDRQPSAESQAAHMPRLCGVFSGIISLPIRDGYIMKNGGMVLRSDLSSRALHYGNTNSASAMLRPATAGGGRVTSRIL